MFSALSPTHKRALILIALTIGSLLTGFRCDILGLSDPLEEAVDVLDEAIETLENESADWQAVLEDTMDQLSDTAHTTIRDDVDAVLQRAVAAVGVETRCELDFLRTRVRGDLIRIKADLLGLPSPEPEPFVCTTFPDTVKIEDIPASVTEVLFYGYDLKIGSFQATLNSVHENRPDQDISDHLAYPTHYKMTLNVGPNGVPDLDQNDFILLKRNGLVAYSISIIQALPEEPEEPEMPPCLWTGPVSEETDSARCPSGFALKGVRCYGSYCDNKLAYCCPYQPTADPDATASWKSWFTDGDNDRSYTNSGFVAGIDCRGNYCDDVRLRVVTSPHLDNVRQCYYAPFISEESPNNEKKCMTGFLVAGMKCRGDYCDDVSIRCCRYDAD